MKAIPIIFDGSVAQNYDDLLGSFVFEPFAIDIVERIEKSKALNVLELASGTGRVTYHLSKELHTDAKLTATDLNPGMIAVAKQRVTSESIIWETADMSSLPYQDQQFDLVVIQFGLMFVPDKIAALKEIYRVLKKGGQLIFNTWGPIVNNRVWEISNTVVNSFMGEEPTTIFTDGPFCMDDQRAVLEQLNTAGFSISSAQTVTKKTEIENAASAARGFIYGLPVLNRIQAKIPNELESILSKLEKSFIIEIGDSPLVTSLQALVFKAIK